MSGKNSICLNTSIRERQGTKVKKGQSNGKKGAEKEYEGQVGWDCDSVVWGFFFGGTGD